MEFPLIEHELGFLGRRRSTYMFRFAPIGLLSLVIASLAATTPGEIRISGPGLLMSSPLGIMSEFASMLQYAVIFLVAPVFAATAIAKERQAQTIGLLGLADYRGYDVYVAKFVSVCVPVGAMLLAVSPIVAWCAGAGALEWGSVLREQFDNLVLLIFVTAVGLLCSARASRPADAVMMTYAALLFWLFVVQEALWRLESILPASLGPDGFLWLRNSALIPLALAGAAAYWTIRLLSRETDAGVKKPKRTRKRSVNWRDPHGIVSVYQSIARGNGSAWLSGSNRWKVATGCTIIFFVLQWNVDLSCSWLVLFILAYDGVSSLAAAKRDGAFDSLACTPASDKMLSRALVRVHFERGLVFLPALVLSSLVDLFWGGPFSRGGISIAEVWHQPGATGSVVLLAVIGEIMFLWFVTVMSCVASSRVQSIPRQIVGVAISYFIIAFIGGMVTTMVIATGARTSVSLTLNPLGQTGFLLLLGQVALLGIVASVYTSELKDNVGAQWRNGGASTQSFTLQKISVWNFL